MTRRTVIGLGVVFAVAGGLIAYRAVYVEPREWGALCAAAGAPLACLPRTGLLWLQREYLFGAISLGLGLWALLQRAPFVVAVAAVAMGVAGVENYNVTWSMVGASLGAWRWLRAEEHPIVESSKQAVLF